MKDKRLATIFLIVFVDLLGVGIILPLLPYLAETYHANPVQIGLLTATYSLFQLISSPILGRLSDKYGRRKLLLFSQVGTMAGFILLGCAKALPLIFLSRIIDGATGGNISIAQAYIADVTTKENRAKGMGIIGAAFGLGFIIGPAVGGLLSRISFSTPAFFAAGISLLTILLTFFTLKESVNVEKAVQSNATALTINGFKKIIKMHPLGLYIFTFLTVNLIASILQGNFALWTQKRFGFGPSNTGWLFAYIGIMVVIIQLKLLPLFLKRFKERKLMTYGLFSLGIGLLLLTLAISPIWVLIPLAFTSLGQGLFNPTIQALASENVNKEDYGETLGIMQSAGSLGRILGPIIGGELFMHFGPNEAFIVSGVAMILVALFVVRKKKALMREVSNQPVDTQFQLDMQ